MPANLAKQIEQWGEKEKIPLKATAVEGRSAVSVTHKEVTKDFEIPDLLLEVRDTSTSAFRWLHHKVAVELLGLPPPPKPETPHQIPVELL